MMKSPTSLIRFRNAVGVMLALSALFAVVISTVTLTPDRALGQNGPTATRTISPASVVAGDTLTVTITAAGIGVGGAVTETLPPELEYVSSTHPLAQLETVDGVEVITFALIDLT